jgi:hypothetical protein
VYGDFTSLQTLRYLLNASSAIGYPQSIAFQGFRLG